MRKSPSKSKIDQEKDNPGQDLSDTLIATDTTDGTLSVPRPTYTSQVQQFSFSTGGAANNTGATQSAGNLPINENTPSMYNKLTDEILSGVKTTHTDDKGHFRHHACTLHL